MRIRVRGIAVLAAVAAGALALSACGETTIVAVTTTSTTVVDATTTLPAGTAAQLVVKLRDTAFLLSPAMIEGRGKQVIDELDRLWNAIKAQLPRTTFVESAGHQIDLMRAGVERKRAADVDKAALHLDAIADAGLAGLQGA